MRNFYNLTGEIILSPSVLLREGEKVLPPELINILKKCYIFENLFGCTSYEETEPWDKGQVLGYDIICPDENFERLESFKNILDNFGKMINQEYYTEDDLRPYGTFMLHQLSEIIGTESGVFGDYHKRIIQSGWNPTNYPY